MSQGTFYMNPTSFDRQSVWMMAASGKYHIVSLSPPPVANRNGKLVYAAAKQPACEDCGSMYRVTLFHGRIHNSVLCQACRNWAAKQEPDTTGAPEGINLCNAR